MRARTVVLLLVAAVVATTSVTLSLAGRLGGEARGPVDAQVVAWNTGEGTTALTDFQTMMQHGGISIVAKGPVTVIVGARIEGNPVDIRVSSGSGNMRFRPGPARVLPGGSSTVSFVSKGSSRPKCHTVYVEWRSPTGDPATFKGGNITVLYNRARVRPRCNLM